MDQTFHPGIRGEALIVMGHGITGDKDRPLLVALAEGLAERGWPCLRISFTGHGKSGGRFEDSCISKCVEDLQDLLDSVPDDVAVVYLGHSMGAAVGALAAARDLRIRGLISIAGMTHTADFVEREFSEVEPGKGCMWGDRNFPLSRTLVNDFRLIDNTLLAAETVTQPWLVIHGGADDVVPLKDGRDVFEAASGEKEWLEIPGAGHLFGERSYPLVISAVDDWLETCFGPG